MTNGVIGTSGWFMGVQWALITTQDPNGRQPGSVNGGNVVGGQGGLYNFATGQWTTTDASGDTYLIPVAYPGTDESVLKLIHGISEETPSRPVAEPGSEVALPSSTWIALSQTFVAPVALEAEYPLVITDAAAERRIDLAAQLVTALGSGQIGSAIDQAKRLQWVYIWSGVRALPEADRSGVREDLRTPAISSGAERDLVAMAAGLVRLDLATTITQAVTDGTSSATTPALQASCVNALAVGRVRAARAACTS